MLIQKGAEMDTLDTHKNIYNAYMIQRIHLIHIHIYRYMYICIYLRCWYSAEHERIQLIQTKICICEKRHMELATLDTNPYRYISDADTEGGIDGYT